MEDGSDLPVTVLNGKPGYINFLDALNSIQPVSYTHLDVYKRQGLLCTSIIRPSAPAATAALAS